MFRHCRSGLLQKAIDDRDRFLTRAQNTAQIFFCLLEFGFLLFGFSADCGQLGLYFRRGGFVIEGLLQGFDCGAGSPKKLERRCCRCASPPLVSWPLRRRRPPPNMPPILIPNRSRWASITLLTLG